MTPPTDASATDLIRYVQSGLDRAHRDPRDDWRLPVLISSNEGRVVVLRSVDPSAGTWTFFTDCRTPKVSQFAENRGEASATFYHQKDRTQLRFNGEVIPAGELERRRIWKDLSIAQKSSYAAFPAPGSKTDTATDGLSQSWREGSPTQSEVNLAYENFAVYLFKIKSVELLVLHKTGHRRCAWDGWNGENFTWLIP